MSVKVMIVTSLLVAGSQAQVPKGICPPGWTPSSQNCYLISNTLRNFTASSAYCSSQGAWLVDILDASENYFVRDLTTTAGLFSYVWIGIENYHIASPPKWTSGAEISYSNWSPLEPNNSGGNEQCVGFYLSGGWDDLICSYVWPAVCEMQARSAPECPDLTAPQNGAVHYSDKSVTSEATYSCDSGYALTGAASVRLCQADYTWSATPPTCELETAPECPDLTAPQNGAVHYSDKSVTSEATYSCDSGYALTGAASVRLCQADYTWSATPPTCEPKNCGSLTVADGSVTYVPSNAGPVYGVIAMFTCDTGFRPIGSHTRYCDTDGAWTDATPTCVVVDCGALTAPTDGTVVLFVTTYGETATFSCDSGYVMMGSDTTVCQADGHWSNPAPTCTINAPECPDLTAPQNGAVHYSDKSVTSEATYSCDSGYALTGATSVRLCQADYTWSATPPICELESICPTGWTPFSQHCYLISNTRQNFTASSGYCSSQGAWQVDIQDTSENEFVRDLATISGSLYVWIGIENYHIASPPKWTSGAEISYSNWSNGEPNNAGGNEQCVGFLPGGGWNDLECVYEWPAVCEMEASPVEVTDCTRDSLVLTTRGAATGGIIYVQGQGAACKQGTRNGTYTHTFDFASCGIAWNDSITIVLQKNALYQTGDDLQIPVTCLYDLADLTVDYDPVSMVKDDSAGQNRTVKPTASMSLYRGGVEVDGQTVKLTDTLTMIIQLEDQFTQDFDIKATYCSASIIDIIVDSCPTDTDLFPAMTRVQQGELSATFGAFRTTDLNGGAVDMAFSCTLQVCLGPCSPTVCADGSQGYGRRRRQTNVDHDAGIYVEDISVGSSVSVATDPLILESHGENIGICVSKTVFVTSTSLFVCLLLTSSLTSFIVFRKMRRRAIKKR